MYGEYLSERFEMMICDIAKVIAKIAANTVDIVLNIVVIGISSKSALLKPIL